MTIFANGDWKNNGELIADAASLYIEDDWVVCDPTYGLGKFYTIWQPRTLIASDIDLERSPVGFSVDFRRMPWVDGTFDAVIFDPPYKLNGRPTESKDERYGVHVRTDWRDRYQLIFDGIDECMRVLRPKGILMVKCQDQVCGGKVRFQTLDFSNHAISRGAELIDSFNIKSYRPQPKGRSQKHARRNYSTLLVFRKGKEG